MKRYFFRFDTITYVCPSLSTCVQLAWEAKKRNCSPDEGFNLIRNRLGGVVISTRVCWLMAGALSTAAVLLVPLRAQAQVQSSSVPSGRGVSDVRAARRSPPRSFVAGPSFHPSSIRSFNVSTLKAARVQNINAAQRSTPLGMEQMPTFRPPQCFVPPNLGNRHSAAISGTLNLNLRTNRIANSNPTSRATGNQQFAQINKSNRVSGNNLQNHVFAQRSAKRHPDWDRNHDYWRHGHLFHFVGLLFRLYVPTGGLWETEIEKLLSLFKDYLARIAGISVRLHEVSTNKGVIYTFHRQGRPGEGPPALSEYFAEFSRIVNLCVSNPSAAEEILRRGDLSAHEITRIVAKYGKEMRRLQVDLKHSREEKILSIRHRLESELVDATAGADVSLVQKLVDSLVPASVSTGQTPQLLPLPVLAPAAPDNLTINFNPQFVQSVQGIVAQEITGAVNLSSEDQKLLELFQKHGGAEAVALTSALHELNDESAPESGRVTAKQRIKRFLIRCVARGGEIATRLLQTYIDKKMLGL